MASARRPPSLFDRLVVSASCLVGIDIDPEALDACCELAGRHRRGSVDDLVDDRLRLCGAEVQRVAFDDLDSTNVEISAEEGIEESGDAAVQPECERQLDVGGAPCE